MDAPANNAETPHSHKKRKRTPFETVTTEVEQRLADTAKRLWDSPPIRAKEYLDQCGLKELYKILDRLANNATPVLTEVRQSIQGQAALWQYITLAVLRIRKENKERLKRGEQELTPIQACEIIMRSEFAFKKKLEDMGMEVQYEADETIDYTKPSLILANHHGGGVEVYLAQVLTFMFSRVVLKKELMYPFYKDALIARGAVEVDRKKLSLSKEQLKKMSKEERTTAIWKTKEEVERITREIVDCLEAGENMLLFYEGTRSEDGEIAGTPRSKGWMNTILKSIEKEIKKRGLPEESYQKLLITFNTQGPMPDAPEKSGPFTRFRVGTPLAAKLEKLENLDPETIKQRAETTLKKILIDIILKHQEAFRSTEGVEWY